jgi:hypothetical protein
VSVKSCCHFSVMRCGRGGTDGLLPPDTSCSLFVFFSFYLRKLKYPQYECYISSSHSPRSLPLIPNRSHLHSRIVGSLRSKPSALTSWNQTVPPADVIPRDCCCSRLLAGHRHVEMTCVYAGCTYKGWDLVKMVPRSSCSSLTHPSPSSGLHSIQSYIMSRAPTSPNTFTTPPRAASVSGPGGLGRPGGVAATDGGSGHRYTSLSSLMRSPDRDARMEWSGSPSSFPTGMLGQPGQGQGGQASNLASASASPLRTHFAPMTRPTPQIAPRLAPGNSAVTPADVPPWTIPGNGDRPPRTSPAAAVKKNTAHLSWWRILALTVAMGGSQVSRRIRRVQRHQVAEPRTELCQPSRVELC